uniref:Major facilitator superfamily (MFS) profile domain-containing protein n=1 Tax=Acrobeloides nanus TaxID=290746 RepID=A0A914E256_9BILA
MWPYLNTIDPSTTATFFGFITASFSLGQAITSPLFGFWMNKIKSVKPPLTMSLVMMMTSNLIYASMELFPQANRRYIMLAARFFIGMAAGDVAVMRAYAATASIPKDRPRAVVIAGSSWTLGLTLGPAFPVIFSPLGYPGWKLFGHLHFDMYTAPAWVSLVNNVISLILLHTIFHEAYVGVASKDAKSDSAIQQTKINKFGVFICILTRFALLIVFTNNETIGSLFSMAMYNWTNAQAVKYYGLIQVGQAAIDFIMNMLFIVWLGQFLGNKKLERLATIFGLSLMLVFHLLTFPWPFWPNKLKYSINQVNGTATEITGCYTQTYSWCPSTHQVPLVLYAFSMIVIMAIALAMAFLPINILYCKILGNNRQGTMTGILFMAGSIARTIGPIIVSSLFDHFGPEVTWGMEILVLGATISIWVVFYRKIIPYDEAESIQSDEISSKKDSFTSSKTDSTFVERL